MKYVPLFQAAIAAGFHLFPFRTEKLSPPAPMVLPARRESRSPPSFFEREPPCNILARGLLVFWWEGEQSEDSEYSEFPEKMKNPGNPEVIRDFRGVWFSVLSGARSPTRRVWVPSVRLRAVWYVARTRSGFSCILFCDRCRLRWRDVLLPSQGCVAVGRWLQ